MAKEDMIVGTQWTKEYWGEDAYVEIKCHGKDNFFCEDESGVEWMLSYDEAWISCDEPKINNWEGLRDYLLLYIYKQNQKEEKTSVVADEIIKEMKKHFIFKSCKSIGG